MMLSPRLLFWRLLGPNRYLELIWYRALSDLRVEASRAYLGILWWVFEPLLYMATFYLVFAVGFRSGGEGYVPYLLTGLVPWKWFASTVLNSSNMLFANKSLMQQVYLPKYVLLGVVLVSNTTKFFLIFGLLVVYLLFAGYSVTTGWLYLPLIMLVQIIMMLALGGLAAAILPFAPDLRLIVENGLMVIFFASAIFYDLESRSEEIRFLLSFNPMLQVIEAYRDVLIREGMPNLEVLCVIVLICLPILLIAYALLRRFDRVYPKIVI